MRYERLDDEGLFGGIDQVLQEVTATLEYKFADGFLVRGEFRRDWSNERFFTGRRPGDLRDHQNTALVGLVWWFGNKTGSVVAAMPDVDLRRSCRSLFFIVAAAYVAGCRRLAVRPVMTLESIVGLVISVLLLVYLVYAMLRPEKF